jgi:hypothetical protein
VPLRKVCRRPETDYRLQQLHAVNEAASMDHQKTSMDPPAVSAPRVTTPVETLQKQRYADAAVVPPVLHANVSVATLTVIPEPKQAETSSTNIAGKTNVPPAAAFVSTAPGGSIENRPEAN